MDKKESQVIGKMDREKENVGKIYTKEEIHIEKNCGNHNKRKCNANQLFVGISTKVTSTLENGFYKWGLLSAHHPWLTILASLVVCGGLTSGMIFMKNETNTEVLWTPYGSPFIQQRAWIAEHFPRDKRYETVIGTASNVLTADIIKYLFKIDDKIRNAKSEAFNKTYEDLCFRYPGLGYERDGECVTIGVLELFSPSETLTDKDVRQRITKAIDNPKTRDTIGPYIAGVVRNTNSGEVESATALMLIWLLKENTTDPTSDNPAALDWELKFVEATQNTPNEKPTGLSLFSVADRSFDDEIADAVNSNYGVLFMGFALLFIYVSLSLGNLNIIEQRVLVALAGMLVIGLALGASFGGCFYAGLSMNVVVPSIPFLILGIGVDDMFIIVQSLSNITDCNDPAERVALALKHAGVSVTVTSITDMAAFLIGSSSSMPVMRTFCLFAAAGVAFLYLFAITFFVGCLTLDERRQSRQISARAEWNPPAWTRAQPGTIFFKQYLAKWILLWPVQVAVLAITVSLTSGGVYGVFHLESNYDASWYMRPDSYQVSYLATVNSYFKDQGERVEVYIGEIDYEGEEESLKLITTFLEKNQYVTASSVDFWYMDFLNFKSSNCQETNNSKSNHSNSHITFNSCLVSFFLSTESSQYFQDIKVNITMDDPHFIDQLINGNFKIMASRAKFQHKSLENTTIQSNALDMVRADMEKIKFNEDNFRHPIPYAEVYVEWDAFNIMSSQLIRNVSYTFLAIAVISLLFVADVIVSILVFVCVFITIVDIAGCAFFMGLTIENTTAIIIILSVGLGLDYIAHVGVSYVVTPAGDRATRASTSLGLMGTAIFNGGFSTFLAFVLCSGSDYYAFLTFFKMFASVVLFGLFHGLLVLPILLSLIGPNGSESMASYDLNQEQPVTSISDSIRSIGLKPEKPRV